MSAAGGTTVDHVARWVEAERRAGESLLAECLMASPNRFSPDRSGGEVLTLAVVALLFFLPLGPLAILRAVRCADQHHRAGLPAPLSAWAAGLLGTLAVVTQVTVVSLLA